MVVCDSTVKGRLVCWVATVCDATVKGSSECWVAEGDMVRCSSGKGKEED